MKNNLSYELHIMYDDILIYHTYVSHYIKKLKFLLRAYLQKP